MQIIIQAIGRLHRTNSNSDMFLLVDNKLTKILSKFENHEIPRTIYVKTSKSL